MSPTNRNKAVGNTIKNRLSQKRLVKDDDKSGMKEKKVKMISAAKIIKQNESSDNIRNIDQIIREKQQSIMQSLVPGIGPIEEEISVQNMSVSDDSSAYERKNDNSSNSHRVSSDRNSRQINGSNSSKDSHALSKQPYSMSMSNSQR